MMDRDRRTASLIRTLLALTFAAVLIMIGPGYSDAGNTEGENLDWPQWRGPNRDGISYEEGILTDWQESGPETLWQISVGDGYSGVSAASGKLYLRNQKEMVCLDITEK